MARPDKPALIKILEYSPEFKPSEVTVAREVMESFLDESDDYNIFIALADDSIIGYVCYGPTPLTESTWDIYWLAVSPQSRGKGAGGSLLTFAEQEIKKGGGKLIIIETSAKSEYEKTRQFYFSHGYKEVSRITDFYATGDDKLILQKKVI